MIAAFLQIKITMQLLSPCRAYTTRKSIIVDCNNGLLAMVLLAIHGTELNAQN